MLRAIRCCAVAAAVVERKGDVALCYVVMSAQQRHRRQHQRQDGGEEEEEELGRFFPTSAKIRSRKTCLCPTVVPLSHSGLSPSLFLMH